MWEAIMTEAFRGFPVSRRLCWAAVLITPRPLRSENLISPPPLQIVHLVPSRRPFNSCTVGPLKAPLANPQTNETAHRKGSICRQLYAIPMPTEIHDAPKLQPDTPWADMAVHSSGSTGSPVWGNTVQIPARAGAIKTEDFRCLPQRLRASPYYTFSSPEVFNLFFVHVTPDVISLQFRTLKVVHV
jgi:hypothetical protein